MKGRSVSPLYYNRLRLLAEIRVGVSPKHENEVPSSGLAHSEKFKQFTDLPLDIIFETSSYLEPTDLLILIRVNKLFRSVFLSRSSLAVWRRCLSGTPHVPVCPSFLNEPQLASLLFDTYCMICCSNDRVTTDLGLCLRLCGSCQNEYIITGRKLIKLYNRDMRAIFSLIPRSIPFVSRARMPNKLLSASENSDSNRYFLPEAELIMKLYKQQYKSMEKVEDSVAFQQQQAKATSIVQFSVQLLKFARTTYQEKSKARRELFAQRTLQIKTKLIELGYEEKYLPSSCSHWDNQMAKKPITDEEWPDLLRHLDTRYKGEKERQIRTALNANLEARYTQFINGLSPEDLEAMPEWTVVRGLPSIVQATVGVTEIPEPTDDFWRTIFAHVLDEVQPYKDKTKSILRSIVIGSGSLEQGDSSSQNILQLASTLFDCKCTPLRVEGVRPLHHYPEVLSNHQSWYLSQNTFSSHFVVIPELKMCAEDILLALKLGINATSAVVRGRKFICGCRHPDFCHPLSFPSLVRHVYNEQSWYKDRETRIRPIMRQEAATLFINNHDASCLPDLLISSTDSTITTSQPSTSTMNILQSSSFCSYCYRLFHLHERFDNLSRAQHHMQTKHGVEFEPAHLMDKNSLHSMYGGQLRSDVAYERSLAVTPYR